MPGIHISIGNQTKKILDKIICQAENRGDLSTTKHILAIFAVVNGCLYSEIASILDISHESIRLGVKAFLLKGPEGLKSSAPPGRPPKLTKSQKRELDKIITQGPVAAGFPGACWRSPMIQHLIYEKFGVFYSVNYICQLLKNMG